MPVPGEDQSWSQADLVPRPDPTKLTTEAVDKATVQYRRELATLREIIETRLAGLDEDRRHLWDFVNGWPTHAEADHRQLEEEAVRRLAAEREFILAQLAIVSSVMTEKFAAVDGQFSASKIAVDAALTAQKEAVGEQNKANDRAIAKSETAVKEQLTALTQVSDASVKAMEGRITDARDRLTVIESLTRGIEQAGGKGRAEREEARGEKSELHDFYVRAFMAVSLVVSVIALVITLVHK
jgi:hypothetical protein